MKRKLVKTKSISRNEVHLDPEKSSGIIHSSPSTHIYINVCRITNETCKRMVLQSFLTFNGSECKFHGMIMQERVQIQIMKSKFFKRNFLKLITEFNITSD